MAEESGTTSTGTEDAGADGVKICVVEAERKAGELVGGTAEGELAGVNVRVAAAAPGAGALVP